MVKKRNFEMINILLFSTLLWVSTGCAGPSEMTRTSEPVSDVKEEFLREVIPLWESKVPDGKEWTDFVHQELDSIGLDLLNIEPSDRDMFCPNYDKMSDWQKKQYWTFILSMMVKFESRFNTNANYTEAFTDQHGKRVVSRGLLQISIESSKSYDCGIQKDQELHDPLKNLSCGIRILSRWVKHDGRIAGKESKTWMGGARYWSVLRSASAPYKSILKASQSLSICKQ